MAHKPTAKDHCVALPADRSTSFIDIQLIAQAFARLHQLSGNDGGQCMTPGISSSMTNFTKCGSHANTLGTWVLHVNKLICISFIFNARRQKA
ncbi:hypothetical protein LCGC14_0180000 [marine sediment metagenome]|uniref:Uncharacterized protein n=1 Tax=marine sediment metagenome TaxID=412755 RepID=A0A0F9V651_9ZZZZ